VHGAIGPSSSAIKAAFLAGFVPFARKKPFAEARNAGFSPVFALHWQDL
jgi:hypothetical protein